MPLTSCPPYRSIPSLLTLGCKDNSRQGTCQKEPSPCVRLALPMSVVIVNRKPNTWLVPTAGPDKEICLPRIRLPPFCRRGVNLWNLRPLATTPAPVWMALLNARSLTNKTFITQGLDFFCVADCRESYAFSELLSSNCTYLSSPRTTSQGGGIATVYKENFFL